jgi:hypothetical protein
MAEPNLINTTSCYIESTKFNLGTSISTLAGSKATTSNPYLNKSIKVVSCYFANATASTQVVTAQINNPGSIVRYLAYQTAVPAKSTLVLITRDAPVHLMEYEAFEAYTTGSNLIHAITNFELYDDA